MGRRCGDTPWVTTEMESIYAIRKSTVHIRNRGALRRVRADSRRHATNGPGDATGGVATETLVPASADSRSRGWGCLGAYLGAEAQEALADSDDLVLMWQGEPFLCAPLPQGREERAGDQVHEAPQASDAGAIAMFHTGCPPDAPLCACVLRDSPLCQDPDGDGRVSLYDNCPYAANPYQENCDGDYAGDACDSNNVTFTYRTEPADTGAVPTGRTTCIYDSDVHSIFLSEVQWTTGTRTIETRQYCGPSGSGTESQVVSEDLDDHSCWAIEYYGCNFNQGGPSPTPVCQ